MTVPEPPTRAAWVTPDKRLGIACKCGEVMLVEVTVEGVPQDGTEFAVTCDCGASHWIVLSVPAVPGAEQ